MAEEPHKGGFPLNLGNILLAASMIIGGVIAWTTIREQAVNNTRNIDAVNIRLTQNDNTTRLLENRVLVLENVIGFAKTNILSIDQKLSTLSRDIGEVNDKLDAMAGTKPDIPR